MPGVALVVWLAAVGYPAVALLAAFGGAESQDVEVHRASSLFLTSTLWTAPSDVLLPQQGIDIYKFPTLLESTNLQEGSML